MNTTEPEPANEAVSPELAAMLAELNRLYTAAATLFNTPVGWSRRSGRGGPGKQHGQRVDAQIRRGAQLYTQIKRLEQNIVAMGGTVPTLADREPPRPTVTPVARPTVPRPTPPSAMTDDELKTADARLDDAKRAAGAHTITDEHRAIKAELGRRWQQRTTKAVRSAAGKKAAVTRARRKALGLPPLRQPFTLDNPPEGGWTDADRVYNEPHPTNEGSPPA